MASDVQRAMTAIQLNDYSAVVILTVVGYDYILTFSKEVEYVWTKPWSRVSTLFVLVRYVGLCFIIVNAILGSSFLPGPLKSSAIKYHNRCSALFSFEGWSDLIFFGASDLVAILRVWALYHRSRKILVALLILYAVQVVPNLICSVMLSIGKNVPLRIVRLPLFSFCLTIDDHTSYPEAMGMYIVQIVFSTSTCVLVCVQFIRQSVEMYRATKQCQLGHYFNALVKEGVIYFLAALAYSVAAFRLMGVANIPAYEPWIVLLNAVQFVPILTLTYRFILNLRELHACDRKRQFGSQLDMGFGLTSQFGHGAIAGGVAVDVDAQENEVVEGLELDGGIRMEERGVHSSGEGA